MTVSTSSECYSLLSIPKLKNVLLNTSGSESLPKKFRALFALRGINTDECIDIIGAAFSDKSALLKHELAYCLGQMQNKLAIPILVKVLSDTSEDPMVRHEAAEALGAIGELSSVSILEKFLSDESVAVRETCQIALDLIKKDREESEYNNSGTNFSSVDPAPPFGDNKSTSELEKILLDENLDLFTRYKAMFTLRNRANEESVIALCNGFKASSSLFRHEIAYVLGQLQHASSIPALKKQLESIHEAAMVRHECAEALGSIAKPECLEILKKFVDDKDIVVRESCLVALDMYEYENNSQVHF